MRMGKVYKTVETVLFPTIHLGVIYPSIVIEQADVRVWINKADVHKLIKKLEDMLQELEG